MRKIIYPLLAVSAVAVLLSSAYTLSRVNNNSGRVLSGHAEANKSLAKPASQAPQDAALKTNPQDYQTKAKGLIQEAQVLNEFPQKAEEQIQMAGRFTKLHDQLITLSVPTQYRQFHLQIILLTSQLTSALSGRNPEGFVASQIKLQQLVNQYPEMF